MLPNAPACPVDFVPVNQHNIRVTAAFVCALSAWALVSHSPLPLAFLSVDFVLRSWRPLTPVSPLGKLASVLVRWRRLTPEWVDQAPKRFAARLGAIMAVAATALAWWPSPFASWLAGVLVLFSFLEAAFRFCAGCHVYAILKKVGLIHAA